MKRSDRRRLDRLFEGELGVEELMELERDAAGDARLAQELERTAALREALEAHAPPPTDRLDVDALVDGVLARLEGERASGADAPHGARPPRRSRRERIALVLVGGVATAAAAAAVVALARVVLEPDEAGPDHARIAAGGAPSDTPTDTRASVLPAAPPAVADAARAARGGDAPRAIAVLPDVPLDVERRDAAVAALRDTLHDDSVRAGFDVTGAENAAAFADRVDAAFAAHVAGVWPVDTLAADLAREGDGAAARFVAARPDWLTASRLARTLEETTTAADALAFVQALAELGAFEPLARRAAQPGGVAAVEAALAGWGDARRERFAAACGAGWAPASEDAAQLLVGCGRAGADALARLALDGSDEASAWAVASLRAAPLGGEGLVDELEARGAFDPRRTGTRADQARALSVLEALAPPEALDGLERLARRGNQGALRVLAGLPGAAPVAALLALDREGLVTDLGPWRVLLASGPARVREDAARVALEDGASAASLTARLVELDDAAAAPALAALVTSRELEPRERERAALALATHGPTALAGASASAADGLRADLARAATELLRARSNGGVTAAVVVAVVELFGAEGLLALDVELPPRVLERVISAAAGRGTLHARQARVERLLAAALEGARSPLRERERRGVNLR